MGRTAGSGPDIASVAGLLGDASRAAMVTALMDDLRLPAGELARIAGISRSTASEHLGRLVAGGMLAVERCGRHTYYRVSGPLVGSALEALAVLAPQRRPTSLRAVRRHDDLARARLCYDHLAGRLGVAVADQLRRRGALREVDGVLGVDRGAWDADPPLGVGCGTVRTGRRPLARGCVDWTVRRRHLAGALGAALTGRMVALGWIERRREKERAVVLTESGILGVRRVFGFDDALVASVTAGSVDDPCPPAR